MNWLQLAIIVCGCAGAWLYNTADVRVRRWAPLVSLGSQPVWATAAFITDQWGAFVMSFVYAALAVRGIHQFWSKRK